MTYELSPIYFSGYQGTTVFYMDAKASLSPKVTVLF